MLKRRCSVRYGAPLHVRLGSEVILLDDHLNAAGTSTEFNI